MDILFVSQPETFVPLYMEIPSLRYKELGGDEFI
ncbi:hypothetical protein EVA_20523, partial [gut metagenome]